MAYSDASYNWYSGPSDYSDVPTDDSRKCQVEGCYRKHSYERLRGGRKIYSKYCSDHTCLKPYPEEEGYWCPYPKKTGERYCGNHLKCGDPGCDKLGEFTGGREYIPWFCFDHRCSVPTCRSRATNRQQQRCEAHFMKCTVPDCSRPCHLHRDGRLDLVCAVHYGTFRCAREGCTRRTGSNMHFCPNHTCVVPDCTAGRDPSGGDACRKHLCNAPSCPNPIAHPTTTTASFCTLHTCRVRGCTHPRAADARGSDFCASHTCMTPNCRSEARFRNSHCPRHACVVTTCPHPRVSADPSSTLTVSGGGGNSNRDRCVAHARARERRAASLGTDSLGRLDYEGLRSRFELSGEREAERERKRLSDDLEALRRRERERERLREDEEERERERLERVRRDLEAWRRYSGSGRDGW
ncbi:hypothetical protein C8A03DRAFT_47928 [Achaetomium macrosporum]|uniref:Uncharacterized protein n=1 Tax=Achaetomium macrosporum TaxID=79813 RepID=A0AAN7HA07_9PEZI|nr:hypothetical protein C8A03DRAFT_47928 [Achaetomium macrosporum]